eukprot:TRINITY_DN19555_c0_g1_i2.p1 TRINITY_DN19555_c0_g1~~TRINITY_DN19555_c0_g1_i2.p1  ORF type:complete len:410 (+),score=157.36 TRINITY_DN19555_c0_g1_i2:44-1231(+)
MAAFCGAVLRLPSDVAAVLRYLCTARLRHVFEGAREVVAQVVERLRDGDHKARQYVLHALQREAPLLLSVAAAAAAAAWGGKGGRRPAAASAAACICGGWAARRWKQGPPQRLLAAAALVADAAAAGLSLQPHVTRRVRLAALFAHVGCVGAAVVMHVDRMTDAVVLLYSMCQSDCASRLGPEAAARVHVTRAMLSSADCDAVVSEAEGLRSWDTGRHKDFATTDIPLRRLPQSRRRFTALFAEEVAPVLGGCYGIPAAHLYLSDGFIVKYDATRAGQQRELKTHQDGSVISFNLLLSRPDDFEGGGTKVECLGDTPAVVPCQGGAVVHLGVLKHSGVAITGGRRYLLVGFVEVRSPETEAFFQRILDAPRQWFDEAEDRLEEWAADVKGTLVRL